jgi:hypothetical protein
MLQDNEVQEGILTSTTEDEMVEDGPYLENLRFGSNYDMVDPNTHIHVNDYFGESMDRMVVWLLKIPYKETSADPGGRGN